MKFDPNDEFRITNHDWRKTATNDIVLLIDGIVSTEYDIFLAIEKLTPYLQNKEDRNPNIIDVSKFVMMMKVND